MNVDFYPDFVGAMYVDKFLFIIYWAKAQITSLTLIHPDGSGWQLIDHSPDRIVVTMCFILNLLTPETNFILLTFNLTPENLNGK